VARGEHDEAGRGERAAVRRERGERRAVGCRQVDLDAVNAPHHVQLGVERDLVPDPLAWRSASRVSFSST